MGPFASFFLPSWELLLAGPALLWSLITLGVGIARLRREQRDDRGPWLELGCFGFNLAVVALVYERTFRLWAILTEDSFAKIDLVVSGITERLLLIPVLTAVLLSTAALAAAVRWAARGRAKRLPLALAAGVFVLGAVLPFTATSRAFIASVPDRAIAGTFERPAALQDARPRFRSGAGVASLAILAAALLLGWSIRSDGDPTEQRKKLPFAVASAAVCSAGAALLLWQARPIALENARPIPTGYSFVDCSSCIQQVNLLEGVGPDEVIEAPLVYRAKEWLGVDGLPLRDDAALTATMTQKRELWLQVNPDRPFPGQAMIDVAPSVPPRTLAGHAAAIRAAGYPYLRFLLTDVRREERPILGSLTGRSGSTLAATLATSEAGCGPPPVHVERLASSPEATSGQLVQRLIAMRRANQRVCLIVS
jgi:hypothetical protein